MCDPHQVLAPLVHGAHQVSLRAVAVEAAVVAGHVDVDDLAVPELASEIVMNAAESAGLLHPHGCSAASDLGRERHSGTARLYSAGVRCAARSVVSPPQEAGAVSCGPTEAAAF